MSKNIYRDVLADMISILRIERRGGPKRTKYDHYDTSSVSFANTNLDVIEPFADFLDFYSAMDVAEKRQAFLNKFLEASKTVDPSVCGKLFVPF